jgi:hypothetical protein
MATTVAVSGLTFLASHVMCHASDWSCCPQIYYVSRFPCFPSPSRALGSKVATDHVYNHATRYFQTSFSSWRLILPPRLYVFSSLHSSIRGPRTSNRDRRQTEPPNRHPSPARLLYAVSFSSLFDLRPWIPNRAAKPSRVSSIDMQLIMQAAVTCKCLPSPRAKER